MSSQSRRAAALLLRSTAHVMQRSGCRNCLAGSADSLLAMRCHRTCQEHVPKLLLNQYLPRR
jgi:hypothetical protein